MKARLEKFKDVNEDENENNMKMVESDQEKSVESDSEGEDWLILFLLNMTCAVLANSVDPDQLASEEAIWSGAALFVIKHVNFYQKPRSSNLIGWKLEVGNRYTFRETIVKIVLPLLNGSKFFPFRVVLFFRRDLVVMRANGEIGKVSLVNRDGKSTRAQLFKALLA